VYYPPYPDNYEWVPPADNKGGTYYPPYIPPQTGYGSKGRKQKEEGYRTNKPEPPLELRATATEFIPASISKPLNNQAPEFIPSMEFIPFEPYKKPSRPKPSKEPRPSRDTSGNNNTPPYRPRHQTKQNKHWVPKAKTTEDSNNQEQTDQNQVQQTNQSASSVES